VTASFLNRTRGQRATPDRERAQPTWLRLSLRVRFAWDGKSICSFGVEFPGGPGRPSEGLLMRGGAPSLGVPRGYGGARSGCLS